MAQTPMRPILRGSLMLLGNVGWVEGQRWGDTPLPPLPLSLPALST